MVPDGVDTESLFVIAAAIVGWRTLGSVCLASLVNRQGLSLFQVLIANMVLLSLIGFLIPLLAAYLSFGDVGLSIVMGLKIALVVIALSVLNRFQKLKGGG